MRILVTDGDNRAALAVVRSLGQRGHWIAVSERHTRALAQTSRYCSHRVVYPDPFDDDAAFIGALAASVRTLAIDVVLPISDVATLLVSEHRDAFEPACRVPVAPADVLTKAADKVEVLNTAMRLGVPVPRTTFVSSREIPAGFDLPFPVVIKPRRSRTRTPAGWISSSVSYAHDRHDLASRLAARHEAEFPLALQECIDGPGVGVFFCYHHGAVVGLFAHRRLREKPPWGGVSVLSESVPVSAEAKRYGEMLLDDLGWQGIAMVEFKQDERDGVPRLMEINGRFWGSLQLAIDAGVDFPGLLLETLNGSVSQVPAPYRTGLRNRWFWGDVDALLIKLFGAREGHGRPVGNSKVEAIADFMRLWGRDLRYESPRRGDLRPFLHETLTWLKGSRS
jgi:predicted ATP-grasp superfamily ATP-dependent carboligase